MIAPAPFRRCPNCGEVLQESGDILECPAEDYRAPKNPFLERWDQFDKAREWIELASPEGKTLIDSLLADLQEMNIRRIEL